ncbi:MAG: sulfite exporter TauE/SafE family protein [Candidatus Omnitrophica bacterium]|nr:sulfite exporter TauE/SafE family protein [Candidatus Omnitrophota bacterium]
MLFYVLIAFWGFFIGALVGLTGIGAGSMSTAGLLLLFHLDPAVVVSANLINGALMKGVGTVKHFHHDHPQVDIAVPFILGGVPTSIAASFLSGVIPKMLFRAMIGGMLVFVAFLIFWEAWYLPRPTEKNGNGDGNGMGTKKKILAFFSGALMGFVSGLTSIGTGSIIIAVLLVVIRLKPKYAVGTAVLEGAILLGVGALAHIFAGHVDFRIAGLLLVGSIPGIWLGSHYCAKAPDKALRVIISLLLMYAGGKMIRDFFVL